MTSYDVVFLETTPLFCATPICTSQEEEDEWLIYLVTYFFSPSASSSIEHQSNFVPLPLSPFALAKPPIVQIYSRRKDINVSCPALVSSSSNPLLLDPSENIDLPIALCKCTRTCKSTYSIANFVSSECLSSNSRSLVSSINSISIPKTVKRP